MKLPSAPDTRPILLIVLIFFVHSGGLAQTLRLAFIKEGSIYITGLDGMHPKKVCAGDDPCISPDGQSIVFTRNTPTPSPGKKATSGTLGSTRSIVLKNLTSGKEQTLPAGGAVQVFRAIWSPDGRWIAFNALVDHWQVVAVHPDGTNFRVLTRGITQGGTTGFFLTGWNYHDNAVLANDLERLSQIDPADGKIAWQYSAKELLGDAGLNSSSWAVVMPDGKYLLGQCEAEGMEVSNLDGPSEYVFRTEFPRGQPERLTPAKFSVFTPWLAPSGEVLLFGGVTDGDITVDKKHDALRTKQRVYRFEINTRKLTPLIKGGQSPSSSRN